MACIIACEYIHTCTDESLSCLAIHPFPRRKAVCADEFWCASDSFHEERQAKDKSTPQSATPIPTTPDTGVTVYFILRIFYPGDRISLVYNIRGPDILSPLHLLLGSETLNAWLRKVRSIYFRGSRIGSPVYSSTPMTSVDCANKRSDFRKPHKCLTLPLGFRFFPRK